MPQTSIVFYQESPGEVPVALWLDALRRRDARAHLRCRTALTHLAASGHELRRPLADYLRNGIYELRVSCGRVNYRILYFFHGRHVAVIAVALTKEDRIPPGEIERAIRRKRRYEQNPDAHSYREERIDGSYDD
jgi:hypothetical protein